MLLRSAEETFVLNFGVLDQPKWPTEYIVIKRQALMKSLAVIGQKEFNTKAWADAPIITKFHSFLFDAVKYSIVKAVCDRSSKSLKLQGALWVNHLKFYLSIVNLIPW